MITESNAREWAIIYHVLNQIRGLKSVGEFYGTIEPTVGLKEIYDRLTGWRKLAYKAFIMLGSFVLSRFGTNNVPEQWTWGRYCPNPHHCDVLVRKYPEHATDWSELQSEKDETMTWEQVCAMYSI